MTEQIESLKVALQEKRLELTRLIRGQSAHLSVDDSEHELIDRMQGITRRDEAVTFLHTLTHTLTAVNNALLAIRQGDYGTCGECGEPIAPKRLQAVPWASNCVRCQEMLDRREYIRAAVHDWDEAA
jgi:DnaK suppressor protein